jgi:hypothetical protein
VGESGNAKHTIGITSSDVLHTCVVSGRVSTFNIPNVKLQGLIINKPVKRKPQQKVNKTMEVEPESGTVK